MHEARKEFPDDIYLTILRCWQDCPEIFKKRDALAILGYLGRKRPNVIKPGETYVREAILVGASVVYRNFNAEMLQVADAYGIEIDLGVEID